MRIKQGFLMICTAVVLASMLSLMVNEAKCIWDSCYVEHGDHALTWTNVAEAGGQRDEHAIDPRKYFAEGHLSWNGAWWGNSIPYTAIEFFSDVYYFTWTNNGGLLEWEDYTYWCRNVDTRITTRFRRSNGEEWVDMACASVANRGTPE